MPASSKTRDISNRWTPTGRSSARRAVTPSLEDEQIMSGPSFKQSEALLARALRTIPLGTQTFSKSKTQYPHGVSPYYISRGNGARVWDVDGNEYSDFINSLAAVTLGYCDPDVDRAVAEMMRNGVVFS